MELAAQRLGFVIDKQLSGLRNPEYASCQLRIVDTANKRLDNSQAENNSFSWLLDWPFASIRYLYVPYFAMEWSLGNHDTVTENNRR